MNKVINFFSLFSSMGTLVCCALPALLVTIGAGSVMASLASNVPGLIWISAHKLGVFIFAGCMLLIGGFMQYQARFKACPIEEGQARACSSSRRVSIYVYFFSLSLYLIGGFMAFVAPYVLTK